MGQIKQNQVIEYQELNVNPVQGPPRDISLNVVSSAATNSSSSSVTNVNNSVASTNSASLDTPIIELVKSQTMNFQPDGSALVDVVITTSDINGSAEYEIRIAKTSGAA